MGCFESKEGENNRRKDTWRFKEGVRGVIKPSNIQEIYVFKEIMGRGHYGTVKKAVSKSPFDKNEYAIKSIVKSKIETRIDLLERELEILMTVDHPNIIKFYEVYEDSRYIHIVMELCKGGELFEQLISKGKYSESEAAKILHSLLSAISHLHNMNIAHRDIKPENIMFTSLDVNSDIKLIDFGLAKQFLSSSEQRHTILGSSYYVAPEVLKSEYSHSCDIWSCGVISFMLLSGKPPFDGQNDAEVLGSIINSKYSFEGSEWSNISEEAKEFISLMLSKDSSTRPTAKEALQNVWLQRRDEEGTNRVERKVMRRLRKYLLCNKIVKTTMNILIKNLNQSEINELNQVFKALDKNHTGFITTTDLEQGLLEAGFQSEEELNALLRKSRHRGGLINYSEFIAMASDLKHLEKTDSLWLAFKYFDIDNRGFITKDNISNALKHAGWDIGENEVQQMMAKCGLEKLDKLFFEQFCRLINEA